MIFRAAQGGRAAHACCGDGPCRTGLLVLFVAVAVGMAGALGYAALTSRLARQEPIEQQVRAAVDEGRALTATAPPPGTIPAAAMNGSTIKD